MAKLEIDDAAVRKLAELLDETSLTEIEYEVEGQRIRVARGSATVAAALPAAPAPAAAAAPASAATGSPAAAESLPAGTVTAPMVGTVYVAGEPGAPPFVKVGDQVRQGQTLLIIEAMKVMNPLASPRAGTVTKIMISDGQPIEFGEPLLVID